MRIEDKVSTPQPKPEVQKPQAPAEKPAVQPSPAVRVDKEKFDTSVRAPSPVAIDGGPAKAQVADVPAGKNLFLEQMEAMKASRTGAPAPAAATSGTPGLTPEEEKSAQEAIAAGSGPNGDATKVADWLEQHPDPAKRQAFMDMMFKSPGAAEILDKTQFLSDSQKQVVADSLESAFKSGAVTKEELQASIERYGYGAGAAETHEGVGEIVARTHDEQLIGAFVEKELDVMKNGDPDADAYRAYGAATALAGLSPSQLQSWLKANPEKSAELLKGLTYDGGYGYANNSPALANLLGTAGKIQPPTKEALDFFDNAIGSLGNNPASRNAASMFMEKNLDQVLKYYQDDSGSLTPHGQEKLSDLFARTIYSDPPITCANSLREKLVQKMGQLATSLEPQANENPPSIQSQRDARLLGSLIGTIEGGFQHAVDDLNAKNAAIDGFVDLMFKASSFIPSLPFPGGGLIKDKGIDALKQWVKDSLHHKPQDAKDAIPFHESFAVGIDNPALRSYYDSARADAFLNRMQGLS